MESNGESSCKGQEDGDGSSSERPLKKARYAWQVKGKHHLKNEINDSSSTSALKARDPDKLPQEHDATSCISIGSDIENYLLNQDCHKMESVIGNTGNSLLTPNRNVSLEKYIYPRYISSCDRMDNVSNSSNMVVNKKDSQVSDSASEDHCIAQWQARQMVKGCVDNTINRLLEMWPQVPLASDENPRSLAHDFVEFINHLPGDNTIENEGILMAISAHGLQNTPSSSTNNTSDENPSSMTTYEIPSPLPSLSLSEEKNLQSNSNDVEKKRNDDSEILWPYDNSNDDDESYPYFSEASLSYPFLEGNDDKNLENDVSNLESDNYDFMNAAVLYAIKSKGLTVSGTDYG